MSLDRIDIIGAGAWGTALALRAAERVPDVRLWAFEPEVAEAINTRHRNPRYLEGVVLPDRIRASADLGEIGRGEALLLVTPAQHLRRICEALAGRIDAACPVVICAKGIEQESGLLLSEIVGDLLPDSPLAVLSGPTFAREVAEGRPTAITLAAAELPLAENLAEALGGAAFRPYAADDIIGAEIGGAIKNVIAIACGITEGLGLGNNARAALITRGLAEMTRLAVAKGGRAETLAGLSGLGDLVLTASSEQSRNFALGLAIGQGRRPADVLAERHTVAEGAYTAAAAVRLADALRIEMPICAAVDRIINASQPLDQAIAELLSRPFRREGF